MITTHVSVNSIPRKSAPYYCITCDVAICLVCVPIKHKSHDISELADKIKELLKEIAKENNRLQSSKHELEINLHRTVELLSSLSEFYKERKDDVSARGKSYTEKSTKPWKNFTANWMICKLNTRHFLKSKRKSLKK